MGPFLDKLRITWTWSNHEGSILSWCWIPSFYGFLFCYRGRPQSHNVSKCRGYRETFLFSFISNFMKNSILSLQQKSGAAPQLYTPFVRRTLVDSELRSQSKRPFNGPALFNAPLDPVLKMSFALLGAGRSHGSREGKRTNLLLHLARDEKERALSIDEQQIDGALGIALFFSPFVQNFFVRLSALVERCQSSCEPPILQWNKIKQPKGPPGFHLNSVPWCILAKYIPLRKSLIHRRKKATETRAFNYAVLVKSHFLI
jgi:hypothetical protein